MSELQRRLEQLERSNRRLRGALVAVVAALLLPLLVAAGRVYGQEDLLEEDFSIVRAQRIELLNADGTVGILLASSAEHGPELTVLGHGDSPGAKVLLGSSASGGRVAALAADGGAAAWMHVLPEGAAVQLHGSAGREAARVSGFDGVGELVASGAGACVVRNASGQVVASLRGEADGTGAVLAANAAGAPVAALSADARGHGSLELRFTDGRPLARVHSPAALPGGSLVAAYAGGDLRAALHGAPVGGAVRVHATAEEKVPAAETLP